MFEVWRSFSDGTEMNLIAGVIWGYDWNQIRVWAHSVHRAKPDARKICFVRDTSPATRDLLHELGIETIEWKVRQPRLHPITTRWEPVLDHLETNSYDFVVVTDVKDCVYQTDPFPWLCAHFRDGGAPIVLATESILSADPIWNQENYRPWMTDYLGAAAGPMADKEVVCGGTIAGRGPVLHEFLQNIYAILASHPNPRLIDQCVLNHLAHTSWRDRVSIPRLSKAFVLSGNFDYKFDAPPDFRRGLAYPRGGVEPFKLYHLYFPKHKREIQVRYWDKAWDGTCHRCGASAWSPRREIHGPRCLKCGDRYSYRGDSTYPV
jgi:hypothetical protein